MHLIKDGKPIDSFDSSMQLNPGVNGEEYRLFGGVLALLQESVRKEKIPNFFGDCKFGERFSGAKPFLSRELAGIPNFPDCIFLNESYIICIDHFQINASTPRSNYKNGDDYRAFLGRHHDLLDQNCYKTLESLLNEEGVVFSRNNLPTSMMHALCSKLPKVLLYKNAARQYIESGHNQRDIKEDLAKCMEVWFLVEDVSPTTFFPSIFNDAVLSALENCQELEGLIYVHNSFPTQVPKDIEEVVFIHNDDNARKQLSQLSSDLIDASASHRDK